MLFQTILNCLHRGDWGLKSTQFIFGNNSLLSKSWSITESSLINRQTNTELKLFYTFNSFDFILLNSFKLLNELLFKEDLQKQILIVNLWNENLSIIQLDITLTNCYEKF